MLPADRTLAMAAEQFRLFRDEFLSQAVQAISRRPARPRREALPGGRPRSTRQSPEVKAGLKVLAQVRGGELKTEKVKARVVRRRQARPGADRTGPGAGRRSRPPSRRSSRRRRSPSRPAPTPAQRDAIAQARAAQAVLEAEFRMLVDDTLRRARQLLYTDPDAAYEDLKRQRDAVLANDQLSARLPQPAGARPRSRHARGPAPGGRDQAADLAAERAADRPGPAAAQRVRPAGSRRRSRPAPAIEAFKELMSQARFELAQQEAQVMIQERISRGLPVAAGGGRRLPDRPVRHQPPRVDRELVRLREDRYLLTMMQTEKSFIPYPDEPPVHFPPAAVWRELTAGRVAEVRHLRPWARTPRRASSGCSRCSKGRPTSGCNIRNLDTVPSLDALLTQLQQEFARRRRAVRLPQRPVPAGLPARARPS